MVENSRYTDPPRKPKTGRVTKSKSPGKKGSQVSFDPKLLTDVTPKYTPKRKPETPEEREAGVAMWRGQHRSEQMAASEYLSERLDELKNPLVRLGWEVLMEQDSDTMQERILEAIVPRKEAGIPPEIRKRLKLQLKDIKGWNDPKKGMQAFLDAVHGSGGVMFTGWGYGKDWDPMVTALKEWEEAASGRYAGHYENGRRTLGHYDRKDYVGIVNTPESGKKTTDNFSTFIHELAHAGSEHLKRLDPNTFKKVFPDYTGPRDSLGDLHYFDKDEQLAFYSTAAAKSRKLDELGITGGTLISDLNPRQKDAYNKGNLGPIRHERYATSPRGLSPEAFRWAVTKADKELQRLQKKRLGRVPAASRKLSREFKRDYTPLGHLPTEHDTAVAFDPGYEDRIRELTEMKQNPNYAKSRLPSLMGETLDYAGSTPEMRKELDKPLEIHDIELYETSPKEAKRIKDEFGIDIPTLPKKRRGGTVKKRYAKGGGIRKPKGF